MVVGPAQTGHDKAARRIESRIILIDGNELARLMIAHGVGVTPVAAYEVKRIDSDYFSED
jgi:restriction system protein